MSVGRWTAITLLTCAALAAAYLPPQPTPERLVQPVTFGPAARLDLVNNVYKGTADILSLTQFRDSLRAGVRARPGNEALTLVIQRKLPPESQRALRDAAERVWRRAAPAPDARLIVLVDPAQRYFPPVYVFPAALDGRTCAVKLMLDWSLDWLVHPASSGATRSARLESWLTEALGPCLFYSVFGQPGPYVQSWLEQRYYKVVNAADWDSTPPTINVRDEPQAYNMIIGDMSFDALGCLNGQLPRCAAAIRDPSDRVVPFSRRVVRPAVRGVARRAFWPRAFPIDDHYLSALVHAMGRERFARFWRSSAPLDSAFRGAFDQPLDVWTEHWARAFAPDLAPFTPAPRGSAVVFSLLTVVLGIGAAAVLTMRRQVG